MSEIDKLVNRAFPDELRNVEPIQADEDAILAMTMEKLGLEPSRPEQPDIPAKPLLRWTERRPAREKAEPELIEVPVVVRRRWVNWAGWAIAACLVLVCALNWGPWLIDNLDFGTGPRSMGDIQANPIEGDSSNALANAEPESSSSTTGGNSYGVQVDVSDVSYRDDAMVITLTFRDMDTRETLDLDQFDIKLSTLSGESISRSSRNNTDDQVVVSYEMPEDYANTAYLLNMEIRQPAPLLDESGRQIGFSYQDVESMTLDLKDGRAIRTATGEAVSNFQALPD